MTRKILVIVAVGLLAILGVIAMRSEEEPVADDHDQSAQETQPAIVAPAQEEIAESAESGEEVLHTDHEDYDLMPAPADDESIAAAVTAAERALETYFMPAETQARWWDRVEPLLNVSARRVYETVPHASLQSVQITGPSDVADSAGSGYVTIVQVPTDEGIFEVVMTRESGDGPWLVDRFGFPDNSP